MSFTFADLALVDSTTISQFVWGVDDATSDLGGNDELSDQDVAMVQMLVNVASQQIIRHVDSDIKETSYVEVWDGAASDELVPRRRPITGVTSVKIASNNDFSVSQGIPSEVINFNQRSITFRSLQLPFGRGLIQVTYTAGYADVPYDIQMATIMQYQWLRSQLGKSGFMNGLKSISKMGETQTKDSSIGKFGLRDEVVGMLETYSRFEAPLSIMFSRVS